jgi:hypothetical protein
MVEPLPELSPSPTELLRDLLLELVGPLVEQILVPVKIPDSPSDPFRSEFLVPKRINRKLEMLHEHGSPDTSLTPETGGAR